MILDDTRISLVPGECQLICGANGAGKSTLLRILAGMERPVYPMIWQCMGMIVGVYGVGYDVDGEAQALLQTTVPVGASSGYTRTTFEALRGQGTPPALVQLGNELTESVRLFEGQRHALGTDNTPYEEEKKFGPTVFDAGLFVPAVSVREPVTLTVLRPPIASEP